MPGFERSPLLICAAIALFQKRTEDCAGTAFWRLAPTPQGRGEDFSLAISWMPRATYFCNRNRLNALSLHLSNRCDRPPTGGW